MLVSLIFKFCVCFVCIKNCLLKLELFSLEEHQRVTTIDGFSDNFLLKIMLVDKKKKDFFGKQTFRLMRIEWKSNEINGTPYESNT